MPESLKINLMCILAVEPAKSYLYKICVQNAVQLSGDFCCMTTHLFKSAPVAKASTDSCLSVSSGDSETAHRGSTFLRVVLQSHDDWVSAKLHATSA